MLSLGVDEPLAAEATLTVPAVAVGVTPMPTGANTPARSTRDTLGRRRRDELSRKTPPGARRSV
jgi:hypothetical protein